jgi:lipid-A-disaccharide synthase-like uncharacterized protein
MIDDLWAQWAALDPVERAWLITGFAAQGLFAGRMLVQWIATERARASVVPELFWYLSFVGGALLFAYAIYRRDPVFILGQGMPLVIYARNIWFIWRRKLDDRAGPDPGRG